MVSPVEEIKSRLDIVDLIGTYVQLKRAGANFSARCPFHSEKTPSFMVSRAKQLWYCFGACSEGGDVFKFLMKIEGLEFPEALKLLADKAGVTLPKYDKQAESKKNILLDIVKAAVEFYTQQLHVGPGLVPGRGTLSVPNGHAQRGGGAQGPALQGAEQARQYLQKRGLSEAVIKQFSLGYAPDSWDALTGALRDKFKAEDVFAAGLTIRSERTQGFYDRFRHRIMFPIRDIHGNAVGFTSRLLDENRAAAPEGGEPRPSQWAGGKYVNTPETIIYNKSRVLYGLDLAREAIRRQDYAIIVEGNMDVIACHQFGMTNVVAASGTALTADQVRLLKRYTNNVKIAFDADPAGENAAKRGIDLALSEGLRIKVITIPQECGKDPDECIRKDLKAWEGTVREAKEILEYYLEKARGRFDINTAQGRSQFVNTLLVEVIKLPDLVEQDFWLKKIGEIVRVDEKLLREQIKKVARVPSPGPAAAGPPSPSRRGQGEGKETRPRSDLLSDHLLALFLTAPSQAEQIIGSILPEMLTPASSQDLYTKLVACYTAYNSPGSASAEADFRQFWHIWAAQAAPHTISTADPGSSPPPADHYRASILELLGDKEFAGWDIAQLTREVQFLIHEIRREYSRRRRLALAEAMRQAEQAHDRARMEELTREFEALGAQEHA